MALNNDYIGEDYYSNIRKRAPLIEYKPIASILHICVYQHKSNGTYYICSKKQGSPNHIMMILLVKKGLDGIFPGYFMHI